MTEQLALYSRFTLLVTSTIIIWLFSLTTSVFLRYYLPVPLMKCRLVPSRKWPKHQKNLLELCQHSHTEDMLLFGFFLPRIANADLKASNFFGRRTLPLAFGCVSSHSSFLLFTFLGQCGNPGHGQNL